MNVSIWHETEMASVSEFDRPPQTVAEMENHLRLMFADMPAGDPPAEDLFGEAYGEEGRRRDMALYLDRLASMASAFAKRLEADHE